MSTENNENTNAEQENEEEQHTLLIVRPPGTGGDEIYNITQLEHPPDSDQVGHISMAMKKLIPHANSKTGKKHELAKKSGSPEEINEKYQELSDDSQLYEDGRGDEFATDGGVVQIEEKVPFHDDFDIPILGEKKDTTLRIERYDLEAGDQFMIVSEEDGTVWAKAEIVFTFTCRASQAYQILDHLNARHSLVKSDRNVVEILQPHYNEDVTRKHVVQGLKWEIIERYRDYSR